MSIAQYIYTVPFLTNPIWVPETKKMAPHGTRLTDVVSAGGVAHPPGFELALGSKILLSFSPNEANELLHQMRSAGRYLEWGSGGSTLLASWLLLLRKESGYASQSKLANITAIGSSRALADQLIREHMPIRRAVSAGALRYQVAKVSDTITHLGWPMNAFAGALPQTECCFDAILVDGRLRPLRAACALQALRLSHANTSVVFHHNGVKNKRRGHDSMLKKWYDFQRTVGELIVMRPKPRMLAMAKASSSEWEQDLKRVDLI